MSVISQESGASITPLDTVLSHINVSTHHLQHTHSGKSSLF